MNTLLSSRELLARHNFLCSDKTLSQIAREYSMRIAPTPAQTQRHERTICRFARRGGADAWPAERLEHLTGAPREIFMWGLDEYLRRKNGATGRDFLERVAGTQDETDVKPKVSFPETQPLRLASVVTAHNARNIQPQRAFSKPTMSKRHRIGTPILRMVD